jgi:hypothetical protein
VRSIPLFCRRTRHGPAPLFAAALVACLLGATARATDPPPSSESTGSSTRVRRLDDERARLHRDVESTHDQATKVRRELTDFERRRQETLRQLAAEGAEIGQRLSRTMQAADQLHQQIAARDIEIEHILRAGDAWVSFTHQIAPLLRARCVACHTAREPGGGHVLTHYAGLLAAGPAGPAVIPGDLASPLLTAVADGSMPKDATALSPDEVDLIRRWISLGARLDAGADPELPLIRVMPPSVHPSPPVTYPTAVPVTALAFDPEGKLLASSGYHEVLIWSVPDRRLVRRIQGVAERIYGLAFHPAVRSLAVAAGTPGVLGEVKLFDPHTGSPLANLGVADDVFLDLVYSADGSRLAASSADHTVRVYASDTGQQIAERSDHVDWVQGVRFSPDGRRLITVSRDATAKVVDLTTGSLQTTFAGHRQRVASLSIAGDLLVATGGADATVRIWNAEQGKEIRRIGGFASAVELLAAVGKERIAATDHSGTVSIHTIADGKRVLSLKTSTARNSSLTVSPAGGLIAVGSLDGTIRLFTADEGREVARWSATPPLPKEG